MKQLVNINLTTRAARGWKPPLLTYGESFTLALRFFKTDDGEEIEAPLTVNSLKAGIGAVDARPLGGQFKLKVGPGAASGANTTEFVACKVAASDLKTALNAVAATATYGTARVISVDGSWLLFFGDQSQQVPLEVVDNGLWPISFGRVSAWEVDGKWVHELRLTQAPVAFTSSHELVLPPAPEITRIREGGTDGVFTWNEIQQLYIPPDFLGSYVLTLGYAKSGLLSREDDIDGIQAALQSLGEGDFKVTLPLSNKPAIEFIGDYAALPQDLLAVQVQQNPPGDLSFTLDLDRAELASALRGRNRLSLPLEIRITATDANEFTNEIVALSLPVIISAPVLFEELEERPVIDWLRPTSPRTYMPLGTGQVLTGNKFYSVVVGDGDIEEFIITHGLATEHVLVAVRENAEGGAVLVLGTDYSVGVDDEDQVTVTALDGAPAEDAWIVMVAGAAAVADWAEDLTVTVPQVIAGGGYPALADFMDDAGERLEALEAVLPSTGPGVTLGSTAASVTMLPEISEVLFESGEFLKQGGGLDLAKLPARAPYMLPAVHDATTEELPTPLPAASANAGKVYQNLSGSAVLIPGGGGLRGKYAADDGFVACDGRALYVASRRGATNSYYPTAFERDLFLMGIDEKQLIVGRTLHIEFAVQTQLVRARRNEDLFCQAQWVLQMELGTYPADSSPSPVGLNLQNVVWADTPIFAQSILLDPLFRTHAFGVRIQRLAGGISLDQQVFGNWTGNNDAAPASANFVIRARMVDFDTENSQPLARAFVYLGLVAGLDGSGGVKSGPAQARIF